MAKTIKSIEERIEDWCKKQFVGQKYYTKNEFVNCIKIKIFQTHSNILIYKSYYING